MEDLKHDRYSKIRFLLLTRTVNHLFSSILSIYPDEFFDSSRNPRWKQDLLLAKLIKKSMTRNPLI